MSTITFKPAVRAYANVPVMESAPQREGSITSTVNEIHSLLADVESEYEMLCSDLSAVLTDDAPTPDKLATNPHSPTKLGMELTKAADRLNSIRNNFRNLRSRLFLS